MNFFFKIKFISLLSILLIPALISGPLVSELIVIFLSIFYLKKCIDEKKIIFWEKKFIKIFILFFIILLFSSYHSEYRLSTFQYSIFYLRFGLATLAILYLLNNDVAYQKLFSIIIFITFIVLLIDSVFQYFHKVNIFGYPIIVNSRVSSFFGNELIMGSFILRIYPLLILSCIFEKQKSFSFWLFLFYSFSSLFLILISGEKTALVLFIFVLFAIFIFLNLWNRKRIFPFILIIISGFFLILNNDVIKNRFYNELAHTFFSQKKFNYSKSDHFYLLNSALTIFSENILTGSGPNTFKIECPKIQFQNKIKNYLNLDASGKEFAKYSCSTHVHNTYFQLLSDTGIFGFAFIFIIFCYLLVRFVKLIFFMRKNIFYNESLCLNIALLVSLFPFAQTGNFFNNWISIIYFLPLPFFLRFFPKRN